uniref:Uncharacterized protein n=1 Tax=Corethron hystrix TaxID=216773 RepID=A0A7S1FLB0_9STRA|mmetsp:Transcript_13354/g.29451  ORF Transcript_13354/g.29451 Transcript_13354/m.29451 type:complete len:145 (+) Transcript_13354:130-564(+)
MKIRKREEKQVDTASAFCRRDNTKGRLNVSRRQTLEISTRGRSCPFLLRTAYETGTKTFGTSAWVAKTEGLTRTTSSTSSFIASTSMFFRSSDPRWLCKITDNLSFATLRVAGIVFPLFARVGGEESTKMAPMRRKMVDILLSY